MKIGSSVEQEYSQAAQGLAFLTNTEPAEVHWWFGCKTPTQLAQSQHVQCEFPEADKTSLQLATQIYWKTMALTSPSGFWNHLKRRWLHKNSLQGRFACVRNMVPVSYVRCKHSCVFKDCMKMNKAISSKVSIQDVGLTTQDGSDVIKDAVSRIFAAKKPNNTQWVQN